MRASVAEHERAVATAESAHKEASSKIAGTHQEELAKLKRDHTEALAKLKALPPVAAAMRSVRLSRSPQLLSCEALQQANPSTPLPLLVGCLGCSRCQCAPRRPTFSGCALSQC